MGESGTGTVKTLKTKLLIGLLPTLVILVTLGLWAIVMFYRLGNNIDVILRENYRSVLAAEGMKEAIERMDSGLLFEVIEQVDTSHAFVVDGRTKSGREQFDRNRPLFEKNLETELGNITVEGEQEAADALQRLFRQYLASAGRFFALPPAPPGRRAELYYRELFPTFSEIKNHADEILRLNHDNMKAMDRRARENASDSIRLMIVALIAAVVLTLWVSLRLNRSILNPIHAVTDGARAMARGELDQIVAAASRDELGDLAHAFNEMARTIRDYRQVGTARLLRAQKSAQATIDSFPDPVVVVDLAGSVEQANPAARRLLSVVPPAEPPVPWYPPPPLKTLVNDVLAGRGDYLPLTLEQAILLPDGGQEHYFLPRVVAIRTTPDELIGAAVVLLDVTKFHLLDRLKSDMVSTVSHELKTPLTSVQMAIHLLLEEVVGPLMPKQVELLLAARQDADRILAMINDLLDLTRIEQGRVRLDLEPVLAAELVEGAAARMQSQAEDAGVALETAIVGEPAHVMVDRDRIEHVFDNLIINAIQHTPRGGSIRIGVRPQDDRLQFQVHDTGAGIPREHLPRIFEKFYRVPDGHQAGGAGLGLAIAREILTAHGGEIEVDSQTGRGTTFTFTLPAPGHLHDLANSQGPMTCLQQRAS
jgi:NtrC-family two-component system sensor histidine kinase KinB